MASLRKRGGRWSVEVCVGGKRRAKTFDFKSEASAWALRMETELRQPDGPPRVTFGEACERYRETVTPQHRGARWESLRLRLIQRGPIASLALSDLTVYKLADWRDARLQQVGPATVKRELGLIGCVLESARRDWGLIGSNPARELRKPKAPPPRRRRISLEAIEAMVGALGYVRGAVPRTLSQRVAICWLLCLETAMRSGEVLGLRGQDVRETWVQLPQTKNGDARQVPLSTAARALLALLGDPGPDEFVAGVSSRSRDALWRKARGRAVERADGALARELADLHFHDSRAEAIFRLSKRLDVLELARMVGHRDPRSLMLYYATTADELAAKLG